MIQWMEDFTGYGTDNLKLLNGLWAEATRVTLVTDPDPSGSGKTVALLDTNTTTYLRRVLSSPQTTVGVAFRCWLQSLPSDVTQGPLAVGFNDVSNEKHISIGCDPSGYIKAYRVDTGGVVTLLGTSSSPVVVANAWRHYEIKVVMSATTAGSVEVRCEGVTVLSVTGIRTASDRVGVSPTVQNIFWSNGRAVSTGPNEYLKDVIAWDGSGSVNNNFMGSCQVYKIVPDTDVSLGWTPSTGTAGWSLINESNPDDDTGYISAPYPAPGFSRFTMTNLPVNVTSVRGVMLLHRSRKTDGGDGNVQVSAITTGGTSNGADRTISSAYTYWGDVLDQAPGATNWNKTLVDGMDFKINRTT